VTGVSQEESSVLVRAAPQSRFPSISE